MNDGSNVSPAGQPFTGPHRKKAMDSLFTTLCDICDELERTVRELDSGPYRDRLEDIVKRLDAATDRTIGLDVSHNERGTTDAR